MLARTARRRLVIGLFSAALAAGAAPVSAHAGPPTLGREGATLVYRGNEGDNQLAWARNASTAETWVFENTGAANLQDSVEPRRRRRVLSAQQVLRGVPVRGDPGVRVHGGDGRDKTYLGEVPVPMRFWLGSGDDWIPLGGVDWVDAGPGNDEIASGGHILGGPGDDTIIDPSELPSRHNSYVDGGEGNDYYCSRQATTRSSEVLETT